MSNPCDPLDYTRQAPLSIAFYRQGYWCGLPFPSPGDLSNPGNEPQSPALQADDAGMMLLALPIPGPPCTDLLEETSGGVKVSGERDSPRDSPTPRWFVQ